jgi:hypothetical protein
MNEVNVGSYDPEAGYLRNYMLRLAPVLSERLLIVFVEPSVDQSHWA